MVPLRVMPSAPMVTEPLTSFHPSRKYPAVLMVPLTPRWFTGRPKYQFRSRLGAQGNACVEITPPLMRMLSPAAYTGAAAPVSPFSPLSPLSPLSPFSPFSPLGPDAPVSPLGPPVPTGRRLA